MHLTYLYYLTIQNTSFIAQMAHLEVQVPPEIVDDESSGETEVVEGGSAHLFCKASGHPAPTIYWRKELVGKGARPHSRELICETKNNCLSSNELS